MAEKLSEELNRVIHQVRREREDGIISDETNLTVAAIFLMDDNWKIFEEYVCHEAQSVIPRIRLSDYRDKGYGRHKRRVRRRCADRVQGK